jgi:hypothetical protein
MGKGFFEKRVLNPQVEPGIMVVPAMALRRRD